MITEIEGLIAILKEMGASDISHKAEVFADEEIQFRFGGKKVEISGRWHNDGTAGLLVIIEDWPMTTLDNGFKPSEKLQEKGTWTRK